MNNEDIRDQQNQPNQSAPNQNGAQQPQQQQPYGYQQPQQPPYGYQQPQQPYYAPQPVVVQPVVMQPVAMPASPAEKEAFFSSAGSVFMLIFCIVSTINLFSGLIGDVLSFNIGGILMIVLDLLIVIGLWVTFAKAKGKKLGTTGLSLIRIPYTIQYVFAVFGFIGNLVIWLLTVNIIGLLTGLISFIFLSICYSSVKKTLLLAADINLDRSVRGKKAGVFAAVAMILSAAFELISVFVSYATSAALIEALAAALEELGLGDLVSILAGLVSGGSTLTLVIAAIAFFVQICGAIVILKFGKKLKLANG